MNVSVEDIVRQKSTRAGAGCGSCRLSSSMAGGLWVWYGRSTSDTGTGFATANATTRDITVKVAAVGTVQPVRPSMSPPRSPGMIVAVPATENQQVTKGEVLAEIDTSAL